MDGDLLFPRDKYDWFRRASCRCENHRDNRWSTWDGRLTFEELVNRERRGSSIESMLTEECRRMIECFLDRSILKNRAENGRSGIETLLEDSLLLLSFITEQIFTLKRKDWSRLVDSSLRLTARWTSLWNIRRAGRIWWCLKPISVNDWMAWEDTNGWSSTTRSGCTCVSVRNSRNDWT